MPLYQTVQNLLSRFRPDQVSAPITYGLIVPNEPPISLTISSDRISVSHDVRDADYLIYGTQANFEALLTPDSPNRADIAAQFQVRPAYPYINNLLATLLNALDLGIEDFDYTPKPFDGSYPFPLRYPTAENPYRSKDYQPSALPTYDQETLPALIADDHPTWTTVYDFAWRLAFKNLRQPEPDSKFVANFIDPAFNTNTFMWDTCFMMMFGRYGRRVFPFMGSLDNFYAKQADDGYICREINTYSGIGIFQPLDPRSTGPNILAWTELIHYEMSGDHERLRSVFPALVAYHRWWKEWRTHPDGSYWTSGWGSGMDNQMRVPRSEYHHRGYSWIDATMQQALNCEMLLAIAHLIHHEGFAEELKHEYEHLQHYINQFMWDEECGFYFDQAPDGSLSRTKTIGAYWGLLTGAVSSARADHLIAHLNDSTSFNRPHRIPSQAYDSADYDPYGGYWLGGVWVPTNYMTLRGLTARGAHTLAHEIALNHVENVARIFEETGTLWENYAPEYVQPGRPAARDFVGWTGLSAISIPIEYLVGIRAAEAGTLINWDIRLTERHGVLRYPLGKSHTVDLVCDARRSVDQSAQITVKTDHPLTLTVSVGTRQQRLSVPIGEHRFHV